MKGIKNLGYIIFVTLITIFLCELVCRLYGLHPYQDSPVTFKYTPFLPGKFDTVLGHSLIPGHFTITKNNILTYSATHNNQCRRIADAESDTAVFHATGGKLIVLGCSFTYGDFLEDSLTHPYLLQQLFKKNGINLKVENWGVGGYCPSQFFLQSLEVLKDTSVKYVVINYGSFQDERTIGARNFRKSLAKYTGEQKYQQQMHAPYFALENGALVLKHKPLSYTFLPLQRKLALVELLDSWYCQFDARHAPEVTQRVLKETMDTLQKRGIKVILTSICGDEVTDNVIKKFSREGYTTLLYGINTGDLKYNFNPLDGHPNAAANKIFADKLYSKICSLR